MKTLLENPACKGLAAGITASFERMEASLQAAEKEGKSSSRLTQLPSEISALRTFARAEGPFRHSVSKILFGKSLEEAELMSKTSPDIWDPSKDVTASQVAGQVEGVGQRLRNSVAMGLSYFNSAMGSVNEARANCLDPAQGAVVASAAIQTLAAFTGAGQGGLAKQFGQAVNNAVQFLSRDKKYVDALRALNDR